MSDIKKPSQEDFDAEFDAFLREENSRMAQLYRKLPHSEPNPSLDAHVRAQARQALRQQSQLATTQTSSRQPSRARRWLPAFGAAATLVLVAGLAWRLAPPTSSMRETAPGAQVAPPSPAPGDNAAAAPTPASESMQETAPAQAAAEVSARTSQPQRESRRSTPQAPSSPMADAAKIRAKSSADRTAGAAAGAAAPALAAPTDAAKPTAFPPAANAPMVQSAPPPPPPAFAAESSTPVAAEQKTMKSAPVPAAAPSTAAPQAAIESRAEAQQALSDNAPADVPPAIIQPDSSDPTRYRWELAGNRSPGTPARSGVYPPDAPPLPTWMAIVRTMLRDGHRDAAKQALADLRARHPDFRVPPDLHGLE